MLQIILEQEHTLNAHEYTVDYEFADLRQFGQEVMLQKVGWLDMTLGFGLGLHPYICCAVWDKVVLWQNFQAVGRHTTKYSDDSENAFYCRSIGAVAQENLFLKLSADCSGL